MQVPGQAVPMHYDSPWFWGASRFTMPQWLLVVMEQSKLWEPAVVRQLQGVAYLHDWKGAEYVCTLPTSSEEWCCSRRCYWCCFACHSPAALCPQVAS